MQLDSRVARAVERGVAFLEASLLPNGAIPIFTSLRRDMAGYLHPDPCVFPTALAAHALSFVPQAAAVLDRAIRFLLAEREPHGSWRHWTRDHPNLAMLPPDLDDTGCASAVFHRLGVSGAADPQLLLANRDGRGLFYTWIVPRLRWTGPPHRRVVAAQLRYALSQYAFFRKFTASPDDVDAVVNANCLFALGRFPGHEAVIEYLVGVLRAGRETSCDKWYENPFVVWYFFSRALCEAAPETRDLMAQRLASLAPTTALEMAHAAASSFYWGTVPEETSMAKLLDAQLEEGAWPRAPIYNGGRARRPDGTFDELAADQPHWGSEALTTAFCLEPLGRWLAGQAK